MKLVSDITGIPPESATPSSRAAGSGARVKASKIRAGVLAETAYARGEYGVTVGELVAHAKASHAKVKKAREKGELREFTGDIEALCEAHRASRAH